MTTLVRQDLKTIQLLHNEQSYRHELAGFSKWLFLNPFVPRTIHPFSVLIPKLVDAVLKTV